MASGGNDRPSPPGGGGERRTGLQYIEPSIDHGRRTISLPDELDDATGAFGPGPYQVWNQACRLLYLQLVIPSTAAGGPWVLQIWDLAENDPAPTQGDVALIVIPGIASGNIAYFSEPTNERMPAGMPFDRGCRVYVKHSLLWVTDENSPIACVRARVKVERCINERCPTCMD